MALLDAASAVAPAARCEIIALHVDHGLSANAARWTEFCRHACAARFIPFAARRVQVARNARIGTEAAARDARYMALAAMAGEHGAAALLLAHHADDQAETTLLQLLRGAGPRGLAAMPAARFDGALWWLRPWLALSRSMIGAYVAMRALAFVDDESNDDPRYRRNALRHSVVPALRAIAPGFPETLVRAAEHQADAARLLDALAELDARTWFDGASLALTALQRLDARRARNLLRWFIDQKGLPPPSAARLADMVRQLAAASGDARIAISHAGWELGVHRDRIVVHRPPVPPFMQRWTGDEQIALQHGTLVFEPVRGNGIAARHLAQSAVTIRSGIPGERLQLGGRARRNVADLLREAGIPQWDRRALPRIYCGETLAALAPIGVGAAFAAVRDEPAYSIAWRPHVIDNPVRSQA